MNLATARSARRALEIGIRKTFGGSRSSLARQFLGESILTALFALVLAMIAVMLLLPGCNAIKNKPITLSLSDPTPWAQLLGPVECAVLLIDEGVCEREVGQALRPRLFDVRKRSR